MNFYSFVQKCSLCSLLFVSLCANAMDNNNSNQNHVREQYKALMQDKPSLNQSNASSLEDMELFIIECTQLADQADNVGEITIALDLKKKVGQVQNYIDRTM